MFERYTEAARRVIFFGRYEASQFGSVTIESEHLLLGLIRQDSPAIELVLGPSLSAGELAREIQRQLTVKEKVSTSIDLPLANNCKRVLAYAAEEAERLGHASIGTQHLLLGLIREETCLAAKVLGAHGVYLAAARETVAKAEPDVSKIVLRRTLEAALAILRVADVLRSVEWYRAVLGFSAKHYPDPAAMIVERENVEIMLQNAGADVIAPASVYIRVHDIGKLRAAVQSKLNREVELRDSAYGIAEFTVTDPDGHLLIFAE